MHWFRVESDVEHQSKRCQFHVTDLLLTLSSALRSIPSVTLPWGYVQGVRIREGKWHEEGSLSAIGVNVCVIILPVTHEATKERVSEGSADSRAHTNSSTNTRPRERHGKKGDSYTRESKK